MTAPDVSVQRNRPVKSRTQPSERATDGLNASQRSPGVSNR